MMYSIMLTIAPKTVKSNQAPAAASSKDSVLLIAKNTITIVNIEVHTPTEIIESKALDSP